MSCSPPSARGRATHLLLALALLGAAGCGNRGPREQSFAFGEAPCRIEVAPGAEGQLATAAAIVRDTVSSVLAALDAEDPKSEIGKINRVAGTVRLQVPLNTFRIIDLAQHSAEQTGGAYDFTLGRLGALWGFGGPAPDEIPSDDLIDATRAGVGYENLEVFDQGAVALTSPLTIVDLGDLKRPYAVDLSILEMRRRRLGPALLRFGDSLRVLGRAAADRPWSADVPHPFNSAASAGAVTLDDLPALAMVRLYERTVTIQGRTYGHVLDPRAGRPAEGTALAVVIGPTATQAHALAYALVVLGVENGAKVLPGFPRYEALVIPDRQPLELWMTPGFAQHFRAAPELAGNIRAWDRPKAEDPPEP